MRCDRLRDRGEPRLPLRRKRYSPGTARPAAGAGQDRRDEDGEHDPKAVPPPRAARCYPVKDGELPLIAIAGAAEMKPVAPTAASTCFIVFAGSNACGAGVDAVQVPDPRGVPCLDGVDRERGAEHLVRRDERRLAGVGHHARVLEHLRRLAECRSSSVVPLKSNVGFATAAEPSAFFSAATWARSCAPTTRANAADVAGERAHLVASV